MPVERNAESIPELAEKFIETIKTGDRPLYRFGTAIVEPVADPETGQGRLKAKTAPDLKWHLRRMFQNKPENIIKAVAEDVLHNPELPFPYIRGLVTTPTFREDLILITVAGYDEQSRLFYAPDPSLRRFEFRTNADRTTALTSLDLLFELLTDFPFKGQHEKQVRTAGHYAFLAMLLTLFLRSSIRAVVPCLGIDGNGQSVGKGLLTNILSWICYGQDAAYMSVPKGREEWASKLDSIVLDGRPFQMIDNIVGSFACDDFASLLTSMRRNIRIKGLSKVVDVPVNTVWVINGNNVALDSDMAQRVIMCHLEHIDPTSRAQENFHIQKTYGCSIDSLLQKDRVRFMQACLDLICAWVNEGAPKRQKVVLAKYGTWEAMIGGIIDWISPEAEFLRSRAEDTSVVDAEKDETITFLRQLMIVFPQSESEPIGVSEIATKVFSPNTAINLRDFVPEELLSGRSFAKKLGRWLKAASTRRWDGIALTAVRDEHEKVWKYLIRSSSNPEKLATACHEVAAA